jgi:predicted RNA-binding Zn ribbon-like protein
MTLIPPDEKVEPPEALRLVRAFVNTHDIEEGRDGLADPESLRRWLLEGNLIAPDAPVGTVGHQQAAAVREAIRRMAMANNGWPVDPVAVDTLNRILEGVRISFSPKGRPHLGPEASGVEGALARIVGDVYRSMVEGTWERFKACRRDVCRWVFYDRSRNRSRTWCAMSICGNREKTRAYYRRKTGDPGEESQES